MDDHNDLRLADESDESDARLRSALRGIYGAPADGAYWDGLETRILSLIAATQMGIVRLQPNLWSVLGRWAAPGMVAAALLFVTAGLFLFRQDDAELRTTYEAVTEPAAFDVLPGAVSVVSAPRDGSSQREATFRYVLSH
ncbi:MAG TPA: hypothetical protein VNO75_02840 [Gemmatimonadaceae bacterium]|nr:hypothetical protein [Gemmatimonadaceae bacterium]